MTQKLFNVPSPFATSAKKKTIPVYPLTAKKFKGWLSKQSKPTQTQIKNTTFSAKAGQFITVFDSKGTPEKILTGIGDPVHYLDMASAAEKLQKNFSKDFLNKHVFEIKDVTDKNTLTKLCIGWGLAAYRFDAYLKNSKTDPVLKLPAKADKKEIEATIQSVCLLRNLVNTPANDLGTDELAKAASTLGKNHKAAVSVIKETAKVQKEFPLIHAVGKASPRKPQLVDLKWGKTTHPKVTIVGKGVVYDTGGLNIKVGRWMRDMKKDMGGAAHALGLASMIMALKLPVRLRVLLPIAENTIDGNAFRPGDVIKSRKGLTIEIDDTDAEGRLVVADALAYASEDDPDLLVDFCTLTGAARVALGYDIPAFFSNREAIIDTLRKDSVKHDDVIWPLPLWEGYNKEMRSSVADYINDGTGRAGAIHGGLFLEKFVEPSIDWVHLDCYAWEQHGKPGRPQGGADTGMRAIFEYIRKRYG